MQSKVFVDVHVIQSVPPSCINRDDSGSPKSAVYGGIRRHRVSSQAWKKAVRAAFSTFLNSEDLGERTVKIVSRVAQEICQRDDSISEEDALELAEKLLKACGIKVAPSKSAPEEAKVSSYLIFVSRKQIKNLAELAISAYKGDAKITKSTASKAFGEDNSIDIALFGRMITDQKHLSTDATCQVQHALSVHGAEIEYDYFTAVDDNPSDHHAGAEMLGTVEFTSSTLYRYATVDATNLAKELGSAEAAARGVEAFVKAFVLAMPTGRENTFANRTRPDFVAVSIRNDQPVSLVNAFEKAIVSKEGYETPAVIRLAEKAVADDKCYGTKPRSVHYLVADSIKTPEVVSVLDKFGQEATLDEILTAAGQAVVSQGD